MTTRAARDLVAVRATVTTGLSLLLATVAHASAGGRLPAAWLLGGMAALTFAVSAAWLGHRTSRRSLALLLVSAQTTLHVAMTALAGHHGDAGPSATTVSGALADAGHHLLADLSPASAPMMATHLVAAALTGLALGQAERALWAVLHLLARAVRFVALALHTPARSVPTDPARLRPTTAVPTPRRTSVWLADTHVRRGPPALLPAPAR